MTPSPAPTTKNQRRPKRSLIRPKRAPIFCRKKRRRWWSAQNAFCKLGGINQGGKHTSNAEHEGIDNGRPRDASIKSTNFGIYESQVWSYQGVNSDGGHESQRLCLCRWSHESEQFFNSTEIGISRSLPCSLSLTIYDPRNNGL